MLNILPNTAAQTVYLTLGESRFILDDYTHYLVILEQEDNLTTTENKLAQVATIVSENERITQIEITTVGLTNEGQYRYTVYGQNSSTNIDPTNAAVVGIAEIGSVVISDGSTNFFALPEPSNKIKYA